MNYPFVSVIMPCRNELNYISKSLGSLLKTDYPKEKLEIIVIDGESDDGTQTILKEIASRNPVVKVLSNSKRIIPAALNIGIKNSKGEIIVRADAHSEYPPDYISKCVESMNKTNAWCVGGHFYTTPSKNTLIAKIIAFILSSPFGVGLSPFRTKKTPTDVDTVPFGAFRRDIFNKVGLYDERLLRTEDNEMCDRITKYGGRVFMDPNIKIIYYARASLKELLSNARSNGMWDAFTNRLLPYTFKWRHFAPLAFFIGTFLSLAFIISGALGHKMLIVLGSLPILLYFFLAVLFSFQISVKNSLSFLSVPLIMLVFFLYHLSYGYGVFKGWVLIFMGLWRI